MDLHLPLCGTPNLYLRDAANPFQARSHLVLDKIADHIDIETQRIARFRAKGEIHESIF